MLQVLNKQWLTAVVGHTKVEWFMVVSALDSRSRHLGSSPVWVLHVVLGQDTLLSHCLHPRVEIGTGKCGRGGGGLPAIIIIDIHYIITIPACC